MQDDDAVIDLSPHVDMPCDESAAVKKAERLETAFAALLEWQRCFGFCRLYCGAAGWYVSNQTDEGLGGANPNLQAYGKTPEDAALAAASFLKDPKIPVPIVCPGCSERLAVSSFTYGKPEPDFEFACTNANCFNVYSSDYLCPACLGELVVCDDSDARIGTSTWKTQCDRCGKVYPRGEGIKIDYPVFSFEPLHLEDINED